jgi:methyltransferase family protein
MTRDPYVRAAGRWAHGAELVYRPIATELLASCPHPLAGRTVLDVGAGTGAVSAALTTAHAKPVAIDLSAAMLRWHAATRPPSAVADVRALPLATAAVDDAVAAFVLNHLTDPATGLAELARVTGPGGAVLATVYSNDSSSSARDRIDAEARAAGWQPPAWYTNLKATAAPLLGSPAAMAGTARAAHLADIHTNSGRSTSASLGPTSSFNTASATPPSPPGWTPSDPDAPNNSPEEPNKRSETSCSPTDRSSSSSPRSPQADQPSPHTPQTAPCAAGDRLRPGSPSPPPIRGRHSQPRTNRAPTPAARHNTTSAAAKPSTGSAGRQRGEHVRRTRHKPRAAHCPRVPPYRVRRAAHHHRHRGSGCEQHHATATNRPWTESPRGRSGHPGARPNVDPRHLRGCCTFSEHTVQDHLKAVFEKVSVRSRGELVGAMLI